MSKPKAVQIMLESRIFFDRLPNDQAGLLIKALLAFADCGEVPSFADDPSALGFAYSAVAAQIRRSVEKYEEKCRQNAENAKRKNSESKQLITTASNCKQPQPIVTVNQNEILNENVTQSQNENVDAGERESGKGDGSEGKRGAGKREEREEPISPTTPKSDLQIYADRLKAEKSQ